MKHKHVPLGHPADPFEAFRQLVYGFGVPELAKLMVMKPGTLYNKADADEDTHHQPTLRDVVLATRLSGDMRVLDSLDEGFGRAAFDVAHLADVSDEALLDLLAKLGRESGEFHAELQMALSNRAFTTKNMGRIRAEAFDMVSALMTLVARLEGLVDD
jgi:hypothetical protein